MILLLLSKDKPPFTNIFGLNVDKILIFYDEQ